MVALPEPSVVQASASTDAATDTQRERELEAKNRQIEILEVKVRRLAAMLKERERRNAEALEYATRNRARFPGVASLQRKTAPQPKDGGSDLMLGIRELNRQIREEIQSLYAGNSTDATASTASAADPDSPSE